MNTLLTELAPNVIEYFPELVKAFNETLITVGLSGLIATLIGLPLGILLLITSPKHILENKTLYSILSKTINIFRSIPFVILIAAIVPFTRFVVGTTIGIKGALVPLVVGVAPFIARQVEVALHKVDHGVLEAARAMGSTPLEIIFKVIIPEGLPNIIHAVTISLISLIGFSAMAGTVGGGGLGDFAIRYGYNFFKTDIMVVTVIILLLLVTLIQSLGDFIAHKFTH
ncbi:ABC transporter permease [Niameybacter massiliensis]|uniref:ABC transporter permease n=1 Tax=Holtiella tumoricola TaxID=3018743 RepID=A0AA42DLN8_9FIRM|nr:methionine ABC transporter permease [Holtiella tumoricola]MDA3730963.1 ABC transporter permease [Holtiella tumoricola]